MDKFPKFVVSRLARGQQEAGAHPDADMLTAFVEQSLGSGERKQVIIHLAICKECREVVTLTSGAPLEESAPFIESQGFKWGDLRWAAALAVACLGALVVWHQPVTQQVTQKVETKPPAPAKPAAPPAMVFIPEERVKQPEREKRQSIPTERERPREVTTTLPEEPPLPTTVALIPIKPLIIPEDVAKAPHAQVVTSMALRDMAQQTSTSALNQPAGRTTGMLPKTAIAGAFALPMRQQSLWSIDSSAGALRKSRDGGRTWTSISVDGQTAFLALSASGTEIWVGGQGGMLFRSTDDGWHWTTVPVLAGEERLAQDITGIEVHGSLAVNVKTESGIWESLDNGVSWHKQ